MAVRFVALTRPILVALRHGDLTAASTLAGVEFPGFFIGDSELWLWRLRLSDIAANPEAARWIARAAVDEPGGFVVGHAGFHGPPDDAGMVEVGYTVVPEYRRRGVARALFDSTLKAFRGCVFLEVRESNAVAREFYKSLGFKVLSRRLEYYDLPPETAIVMKFHSC